MFVYICSAIFSQLYNEMCSVIVAVLLVSNAIATMQLYLYISAKGFMPTCLIFPELLPRSSFDCCVVCLLCALHELHELS